MVSYHASKPSCEYYLRTPLSLSEHNPRFQFCEFYNQ